MPCGSRTTAALRPSRPDVLVPHPQTCHWAACVPLAGGHGPQSCRDVICRPCKLLYVCAFPTVRPFALAGWQDPARSGPAPPPATPARGHTGPDSCLCAPMPALALNRFPSVHLPPGCSLARDASPSTPPFLCPLATPRLKPLVSQALVGALCRLGPWHQRAPGLAGAHRHHPGGGGPSAPLSPGSPAR